MDYNKNGIYDVEPPFADVKVELLNTFNVVLYTTYSSNLSIMGGSNYSFENIPYGSYILKFTAPSGYTFSNVQGFQVQSSASPITSSGPISFFPGQSQQYNMGIYQYVPPITAPTIQVSNFKISGILARSLRLSYKRGNGQGVLIVGREGAPVSKDPVDNQMYSGYKEYGSGTDLGDGNFVIYNGKDSVIDISYLKPERQYYFKGYEYNGSLITSVFLLSGAPSISAVTAELSSRYAGTALDFNGVNSCLDQMGYADCNTTMLAEGAYINNTGVFTMELWLKLKDHSANTCQALFTNGEGASFKGIFFAFDNRTSIGRNKQLVCELYNGSGTKIISSLSEPAIITDNEWHHVAITGDGTNVRFYVDGNESLGSGVMGTKSTGSWTHNSAYFGVCPVTGECRGGDIEYKYWLNGQVDELKFWNITRTLSDIRGNMNLILRGDEPGLRSYLQFNEGTAGSGAGFVLDLLMHQGGAAQGGYKPYYIVSPIPVGRGVSTNLNVTGPGTYDFTGAGIKMTFPSSGVYPDGEVVVTRLKSVPAITPVDVKDVTENYWVIRNYGENNSFSPLENLTFTNIGAIPTARISSTELNIQLYQRAHNATESVWANMGEATQADLNSQTIVFSSANNITSLGQTIISLREEIVTGQQTSGKTNSGNRPYVTSPYPVPSFNEDIRFEYISEVIDNLSIEVSDVFGKETRTIFEGTSNAGINNFVIPVKMLSPGVYLLKIKNSESLFSEKIIVY
ncbi:LamG-like jellyroll fold domain-containing protein [Sporocytophaga myxococcoides]|uniref:LamG-like jellyroll fold domain-containing protein n=1 Tax=Sporocytophaga myxococcoides TaxID=153721 RepID=UPI00138AB114